MKFFIGLGGNCHITTLIERIQKRSEAYPFDYTITSFKGIVKLFSNNFEDFFNEEDFINSMNFDHKIKYMGDSSLFINNKYQVIFVHHRMKDKEEFEKNKIIFERRINRIKDKVNNPNNVIYFVRSKKITVGQSAKEHRIVLDEIWGKDFEENVDEYKILKEKFNKIIKKYPAKCYLILPSEINKYS